MEEVWISTHYIAQSPNVYLYIILVRNELRFPKLTLQSVIALHEMIWPYFSWLVDSLPELPQNNKLSHL